VSSAECLSEHQHLKRFLRLVHGRARVKPDASRLGAALGLDPASSVDISLGCARRRAPIPYFVARDANDDDDDDDPLPQNVH